MVWRIVTMILALGACLMAQGPRGNQNMGAPAPAVRSGAPLDMTNKVVVEGEVTSVSIAAGVQYPSVVVDGKVIRLAPVWYLLDHDFELAAGDHVKILAAMCACQENVYYAMEITKGDVTLVLRDSLGIPLWTKGLGGANGNENGVGNSPTGRRAGNACLDLASVETVTGVVASVNAGLGIQQPSLVLNSSDGRVMSIRLAPERVLLEQDIELTAGMTLKVKVARSACLDGLVALELTTPDGVTIRLRDENGHPVWPR